ncbi:MAG: YARHG domain-containing protein [Lachnospiraceae bacterium]|nr:YARHG domain-containing protein [Lachnospiraceae bacterium]
MNKEQLGKQIRKGTALILTAAGIVTGMTGFYASPVSAAEKQAKSEEDVKEPDAWITFSVIDKYKNVDVDISGDDKGIDYGYEDNVMIVEIDRNGYYVLSGDAAEMQILIDDGLENVTLELDQLYIDDSTIVDDSPVILIGEESQVEIIISGNNELVGFDGSTISQIYAPDGVVTYSGDGKLRLSGHSASSSARNLSTEYIIPDSDSVKIKKSDVENLSDEDLRYAINEIYARHGRIFTTSDLKEYFESKSWYNGRYSASEFKEDELLNKTEKENIKILAEVRDSRKKSENKSEYIFPDSDSKAINKEDAEKLTDEELRIAINEIYARHGRKFNSSDLQEYFESKSWYKGKYSASEFDNSLLNKTEQKNIKTLTEIRDSRKKKNSK